MSKKWEGYNYKEAYILKEGKVDYRLLNAYARDDHDITFESQKL